MSSTTPTSATTSQSLAELSEAQLRRLVEVLQISHPQAVASALGLIQNSNNAEEDETVDAENNESREEKVEDAVTTTTSTATTEIAAAPPPLEEINHEAIEASMQVRPEDAAASSGDCCDPPNNTEVATGLVQTQEEVSSDAPAPAAATTATPITSKGETPPKLETGTEEFKTTPTTQHAPTPSSANPDDKPPSPKEPHNSTPSQPVNVAPSSQQGKKKKKKRPPGKRRASKPTSPTTACTEKENNNNNSPPLQPPTTATEHTAPRSETETADSSPKEPQDAAASESGLLLVDVDESAAMPSPDAPITDTTALACPPLEDSEATTPSQHHQQQPQIEAEGVGHGATDDSNLNTTTAESDPLPVEKQQLEGTAGSDHDDTPVITSESGPPSQNEQQQQEGTAAPDSAAAPKAATKKRPPSKQRRSISDNNSQSNNRNSQPSVAPVSNGSSAATGTISHEVIPWQSDPVDAADDDDLGVFFDGYSVTARYQDVSADNKPEAGCYLLFDPQGGGKLVLHYSKSRIAQAIGFYAPGPGHSIQGFKFTRNHGRVELIGSCASGLAGRKNYYSGFCQFIRAAKDVNGSLWIYSREEGQAGLGVDIYVYLRSRPPTVTSVRLPENMPCCVSEVVAVACLPKNADFFPNVRVDMSKWMGDGNAVGSSIQLDDDNKPVPSTEGLFIPGVTESPAPAEGPTAVAEGTEEDSGCYLVYDADGCRLIEHYSKTKVPGAIGFYAPGLGQKLPGFKFTSKQGRSELIGNCSPGGVAGRKNYGSGWCQFIRAAKSMYGSLRVYPRAEGQPGLDVDLYVYTRKPEEGAHQTTKLTENTIYNVSRIGAVACLPKHVEFFEGLTTDLIRWVEEGRNVGATMQV